MDGWMKLPYIAVSIQHFGGSIRSFWYLANNRALLARLWYAAVVVVHTEDDRYVLYEQLQPSHETDTRPSSSFVCVHILRSCRFSDNFLYFSFCCFKLCFSFPTLHCLCTRHSMVLASSVAVRSLSSAYNTRTNYVATKSSENNEEFLFFKATLTKCRRTKYIYWSMKAASSSRWPWTSNAVHWTFHK